MRILLTADPEIPVPPLTYGGIERVVNALVKALVTRGHEVGLAAHPQSTCRAHAFFPWTGLRSRRPIDALRNMHVLREGVRAFRPDILHSFSRILYMLPLAANPLPKIMCFQREPTPRTVWLGAKLFRGSLSFTGISDYICRRGKRGGGDWRTVYNFVDTDHFRFEPRVAKDAPLVFLSRIERVKGAHTAIRIAQRTQRRLIIAGNHASSGPEFEYWTNEIMPHLGTLIEYIGAVDDQQKNTLLGQAAALIVPIEWNEPFGIVFAEALACGTPVISCPRGALPEIVRQGVDGFLTASVEEACDAVAKIDEIDRRDCRRRAEDRFSAKLIAAQYERLYKERLAEAVEADAGW
jgi:glycosyltransferase involved in cell wall biosynthesis